jgi:membrane protein DedA with SNARE-associated domain
VDRVIDALGSVPSPWGYVIVGALTMLEASAFVGLCVPVEIAMLFGGFMAQQGRADLWAMMGVAAVCGVVGDSIGYSIGSRFGEAIERSWPGRKVGEERWTRAEDAVRRGPYMVFVGRFVGVLRALVPAMAGMSHMRYPTFLGWNVAGGVAWAVLAVGGGYLAGDASERLGHWFTIGGLVLLAVAAAALLVRSRLHRRAGRSKPERVESAEHQRTGVR